MLVRLSQPHHDRASNQPRILAYRGSLRSCISTSASNSMARVRGFEIIRSVESSLSLRPYRPQRPNRRRLAVAPAFLESARDSNHWMWWEQWEPWRVRPSPQGRPYYLHYPEARRRFSAASRHLPSPRPTGTAPVAASSISSSQTDFVSMGCDAHCSGAEAVLARSRRRTRCKVLLTASPPSSQGMCLCVGGWKAEQSNCIASGHGFGVGKKSGCRGYPSIRVVLPSL